MDTTLEGADAVHRMKRGRPAKAAPVVAVDMAETFARIDAAVDVPDDAAQVYALRIWAGQSVDVSIPDRVERVVNGLRGQGLSIAVTLPHPDAARFLAKHE